MERDAMKTRYDFAIIGGGAAAFAAAIKASEFEAKTAMIEKGELGGTCVNVGCVPTKFLLTVAEKYHSANQNYFKGITIREAFFNFAELVNQKNKIISQERQAKYTNVLSSYPNVSLIKGEANFISKNQLNVNGQTIEADKLLIATGSSAQAIPIPGLDKVNYLTNIEALELFDLPKSLIVIGGRALGLEFAQIYSRFGTKVTVLQRSSTIIPNEEPEISKALEKYLEDEGINILTNVKVQEVGKKANNIFVKVKLGEELKELQAEKLLMATGRKANTANLGLEKAGIEVDRKGFVVVNDKLQTNLAHVYAAGDVIGQPMLETVAAKEGSIAAFNAMSPIKKKTMDYAAIPHAVFTDPSVASVGLTDKQVNEAGVSCKCRTLEMSVVPKAKITQDSRGLIKIVTNAQTEQILGIHILSPLAHELIHEATLAVKFKLTLDDIIDTVHIFPTLSESIKIAAQSFKRDISKMSCCVE
jgi:mercuric reductase